MKVLVLFITSDFEFYVIVYRALRFVQKFFYGFSSIFWFHLRQFHAIPRHKAKYFRNLTTFEPLNLCRILFTDLFHQFCLPYLKIWKLTNLELSLPSKKSLLLSSMFIISIHYYINSLYHFIISIHFIKTLYQLILAPLLPPL